jgi:amidase
MTAFLAQVRAQNDWANAIVAMRNEDDLLEEAAARGAEIDAGRSRGWLHGIPQAIKDMAPSAGLRFTQSSPILRDRVATEDAPFVARMRASGAVFKGEDEHAGIRAGIPNPV